MIGLMTYESVVASVRQDLEVGSYTSAVTTLESWLATQGVATPQTRHAAHLLIVALACRYAVEERVSERLKPYIPGLIEAAELLSEDGALAEVKKRLPDPQVFADAKNTKDRLEWLGQEGELRELRRKYLHAFMAGDSDQLVENSANRKEPRFSDPLNDTKETAVKRLLDKPLNQEFWDLYQPVYKENRLAEWKQVSRAITAIERQNERADDAWRILLREGKNNGQVIHPRAAPILPMLITAERLGAVDFAQDRGAHLLALHAAEQTRSAEPIPANGNGCQELMEAVRRHVREQIDAGHAAWADFAKGMVHDLETANIENTAQGLTWLRAYLRVFPDKMEVRPPLEAASISVGKEIEQILKELETPVERRTQSYDQRESELLQRGRVLNARRFVLEALLQVVNPEVA